MNETNQVTPQYTATDNIELNNIQNIINSFNPKVEKILNQSDKIRENFTTTQIKDIVKNIGVSFHATVDVFLKDVNELLENIKNSNSKDTKYEKLKNIFEQPIDKRIKNFIENTNNALEEMYKKSFENEIIAQIKTKIDTLIDKKEIKNFVKLKNMIYSLIYDLYRNNFTKKIATCLKSTLNKLHNLKDEYDIEKGTFRGKLLQCYRYAYKIYQSLVNTLKKTFTAIFSSEKEPEPKTLATTEKNISNPSKEKKISKAKANVKIIYDTKLKASKAKVNMINSDEKKVKKTITKKQKSVTKNKSITKSLSI